MRNGDGCQGLGMFPSLACNALPPIAGESKPGPENCEITFLPLQSLVDVFRIVDIKTVGRRRSCLGKGRRPLGAVLVIRAMTGLWGPFAYFIPFWSLQALEFEISALLAIP